MTISLPQVSPLFSSCCKSSVSHAKQTLPQSSALSVNSEEATSDSSSQSTFVPTTSVSPPEMRVIEGKHTLLRSVRIENMVLPGGGSRNWLVAAALMQMSDSRWSDLKHFSSASGGAINATVLASGISPKKLDSLMAATSMTDVTKDVPNFETMYPSELVTLHPEQPGSSWMSKLTYWIRTTLVKLLAGNTFNSGHKALQLMDQWSASSVTDYAKQACFISTADGTLELAPAFKAKLDALKKTLDAQGQQKLDKRVARLRDFAQQTEKSFEENRTGKMVTFDDLDFLHQLEPAQFKKVTILGLDKATNETIYFNALDYPDMPVAIAAYASMSIPVFFQGVGYAYPGKEKRIYIDGGLKDRVPVEEFLRGVPAESEVRARTVVLDFLDGDDLYKSLHGAPPKGEKTLKDSVFSWVYNTPGMAEGRAIDRSQRYESGPNVYVLDNGKLRTFPPKLSAEELAALKERAASVMQQQLALREQEAFAASVESVEHAFQLLSAEEKEARRITGPSIPPSEELRLSNPKQYALEEENFNATKALYELCQKEYENAIPNQQPQDAIPVAANWA